MLRRAAIAILSAALSAAVLPSAELDLPFAADSEASAAEVLLHGAEVVLTCAQRDGVGIEVRSRTTEGTASAELEIVQRGAVLSVSGQPRGVGPAGIVLELELPRGLPVAISGSDLVVVRTCDDGTADRPRPVAPAPAPAAGPSTAPHVSSFELESSTVEYRGPGTARFSGPGNEVTLIDTGDDIELSLTGGSVDSSGHRGGLLLDAASSVIVLRSPKGRLAARLDGGSLALLEATGEAVVELADASLDVEDHDGTLTVTTRLGDVSVRRGTFSNLAVTGEDAAVRMSGCTATGTATLVRGSLGVEDWVGRLTLQGGGGADLEIDGVEGDVVFSLDDAALDLRHVTGHTRATASSSEVTLSGLKSVALSTEGCVVGVADVPEVKLIRIVDGELDMRLAEARGRQKLELLGEVWARVELPVPCEVRLAGEGAADADVDVRGCDLHGGGGPGTQRPRRRLGEGTAAVLDVTLEAGSKLRVEGRSR